MNLIVDLRIFSPRWGGEDVYTVKMSLNNMEIEMSPRVSIASWRENRDPEWGGESIQRIMNNDGIYPPEILQELFEHVWKEWRSGEIDDRQAEAELQELAVWINVGTNSKPRTKFWKRYF